jgi:hypothetical protein
MGLHGGGLQVCGATSTPRSPRATMMASLSSRISSQLSRASWLSILETISGIGCSGPNFSRTTSAAYSRISRTPSAVRTKLAAM